MTRINRQIAAPVAQKAHDTGAIGPVVHDGGSKDLHRPSVIEGLPSTRRHKVAFLSTWHPEPADNGRKHRTRLMISALATHYDVVLVSLLPEDQCGDSLPLVPDVWRQFVLPLPVFRPRSLSALVAVGSHFPRSLAATWSAPTARRLKDIVQEFDARAVIGADLRTFRYLETLASQIPTILDEPDVSPFVTQDGHRSLRARFRERKYQRLLNRNQAVPRVVVVASGQEAIAYRALSKSNDIVVIENGVRAMPSTTWKPGTSQRMLYTGSLSYAPNAEAVAHLIKHILPLIEGECPSASLTVTGQLPDTLPAAVQHPRVQVTGLLDDLDPIFQESRVFVAPILSGTGTRIKLLEAMAHGIPIVSTSKGAEGLPVEDGKHMLIADSPVDFAAAVRRLFLDADFSSRLGEAGRGLVAQRFTWERQQSQLLALIGRLVESDGNQGRNVD